MNYFTRREEAERIERENNAFAMRLYKKEATITKSSQVQDYRLMQERGKRLRKYGLLPPILDYNKESLNTSRAGSKYVVSVSSQHGMRHSVKDSHEANDDLMESANLLGSARSSRVPTVGTTAFG